MKNNIRPRLPAVQLKPASAGAACEAGKPFADIVVDFPFRVSQVLTSVKNAGIGLITNIYIGNQGQLMGAFDAYEWSVDMQERMRRDFKKENGLDGMSVDQIQKWLDALGITYPQAGRIDLPSMPAGTRIRIEGKFDQTFGILFRGVGQFR